MTRIQVLITYPVGADLRQVMVVFFMWHIPSLQRIDGVLNTGMICCPSGNITNFQLYFNKS